jgi:hypothetical protein
MSRELVLLAYIIFVFVFWHFVNSKIAKTIWEIINEKGGKMLKYFPVVIGIAALVTGEIFIHDGNTILGLLVMLIGTVFAWIWALWLDIEIWFNNHLKHL